MPKNTEITWVIKITKQIPGSIALYQLRNIIKGKVIKEINSVEGWTDRIVSKIRHLRKAENY